MGILSWRRALVVLPVAVAGAFVSAPLAAADPGPPSPSPSADPAIQAAQARAAQLESEIQTESYRINALSEQYDLEQINASRLSQRIGAVEQQITAAEQQVTRSRRLVRQDALAAFEDQGSDATAVAILQGTTGGVSVRTGLADAALSHQQVVIGRYTQAETALHARQDALQAAQRQSLALAAQIQATSQSASNQVAAERSTLAGVNGQIAQLIVADQQRAAQAREEAAQVAWSQQPAPSPSTTASTASTTASTAAPDTTTTASSAPATSTSTTASTPASTAPATQPAPSPAPSPSQTSAPPATQAAVSPPAPAAPPPPSESPPSPPASSSAASIAVQTALAQVGKPYQYGGAGPDSFDCSGLVMYAWAAAGVYLPHYAPSQYADTTRISADELEPGDLVFYYFPGEPDPGHVGMYIGGGEIVVADTTGTPVRVESMYFDGTPMGYGRVG
jgi:cell wall-associated NlpC family hydrolase